MRSSTIVYLSVATALLTGGSLAFQGQHLTRTTPTSRPATSTQRRVAMIEDASVASSALDSFFQSQPYLAAFVTCSIKGGAADLLAQQKLAPKNQAASDPQHPHESHSFDLSRNLSFVFYGGLVQGMFQQFLFSVVYPIMFGSEHTLFTTLQQVAFDVGVMPFVYLPIVYSIKSVLASKGDVSAQVIQDGLAKLADDVANKGLLKTYWSIWIPAQSLTFGVIPPHLRVLFVAAVSFCWVTILSSISSSSTPTNTTNSSSTDAEAGYHATWKAPALPDPEDVLRSLRTRGPLAPLRRPAFATVGVVREPEASSYTAHPSSR